MRAISNLYRIRPAGIEVLAALDVRQMVGQPGYFGSYGFEGWTGIGQASPVPAMHELSHAYWGAFPVTGRPELNWAVEEGADTSSAMARYRQDVADFMTQPPGHYELFRSLLRNIPGLTEVSTGGLFHSIEGDVPHNVGGDLLLLPPILRKYWDGFLQPGPWGSWYEAVAWHKGLSPDQRRVSRLYAGFEHLDLERYETLVAADDAIVPNLYLDIARREERQRLADFAVQFDQIVGSPEFGASLGFWRSYLREMLDLHKSHPLLLSELKSPRAVEIEEALGFLSSMEGLDDPSAAEVALKEIEATPFLLHFLPAMSDGTLVAMFRAGRLPETGGAIETARAFVEPLEKLSGDVDAVLVAARLGIDSGTARLRSFLDAHDPDDAESPRLLFELLGGADGALTGELIGALDNAAIKRLLSLVPATVRTRLDTSRLLEALSVTPESSVDEFADGMDLFLTHISGNFRIDRPQLRPLFDVIVARAEGDPGGTLELVGVPRFPWDGFIVLHADTAVELLSSDLAIATGIVRQSDPLTFPPARFVYRLIAVDPELAARVVERLHDTGDVDLVIEALAHFAYDAQRLSEVPGLPISLEGDGGFLRSLLERRGTDWLTARLAEVVHTYKARMVADDVPPDFLQAYRGTLEIAASASGDPASIAGIKAVISDAFSRAGG